MKASEAAVRVLLEGQTQFIVPLFQRPYSWDRPKWETLWLDIIETYQAGPGAEHFLGSIVTKSLPGTPEGVSPFLLIDGQQRLQTITILLAALRDACKSAAPELSEKIESLYLKNRFVSELSAFKVLPTQTDRAPYFAIIQGVAVDASESAIGKAYRFFRSRIASTPDDGPALDPKRLEQTVLSALSLVSITLGQEDNEYRIFESLNAKGMPLKQVDLIRNYVLMRLPLPEQETIYHGVWRPLEQMLGENLEAFFRYEYMSGGSFVREGDVYYAWKVTLEKLDKTSLIEKLRDLLRRGKFYSRIVEPKDEPNAAIRKALIRLRRWGSQTIHPFLLFAYDEYDAGGLDAQGFASLLQIMESFLVRRLFADVPTNTLNRLFLRLSAQLPEDVGLLEGTVAVLSEPGRRWPADEEFRQAVARYPLYLDSRPDQRRLVLETLEESYGHKEPPALETTTIEHVMPQTLTDAWRKILGPEAERVHAKLLHIVGNLTLTGYNPELSNSPWSDKRILLASSHLEMNKAIASHDSWGEPEIMARAHQLAERCIIAWPGPIAPMESPADQPSDREATRWAAFYAGCQQRLSEHFHRPLMRKTTTVLNDGVSLVIVCLVSRQYPSGGYWWTFHSRHDAALINAPSGFVALGCGSAADIVLFRYDQWAALMPSLNSVSRQGKSRWFIAIRREGSSFLLHRKGGAPPLDVTHSVLPLADTGHVAEA